MQNETKSYVTGYRTGRYWDSNWVPGGPWFSRSCRKGCNANPCPICEVGKQANIDWHKGFKLGLSRNTKAKI